MRKEDVGYSHTEALNHLPRFYVGAAVENAG